MPVEIAVVSTTGTEFTPICSICFSSAAPRLVMSNNSCSARARSRVATACSRVAAANALRGPINRASFWLSIRPPAVVVS